MVNEWTNSCFWCWSQLRVKMSSNDHNYVMSPETAEAVRSLLNVCGVTNEAQPTQQANRSQGASGAASGAPVLCASHRSQEGPSAVSTKRQARQDQVTTMCCENRTWKKRETNAKKGGLHLLAFFCYVWFLISCIYAPVRCILACCFDSVSLLLLVRSFSNSHCTMERRQEGLRANRVRNRGQRGRNPPWYCHCPDCRRDFPRPHVFGRGQVNGLRNVRLRVLRQNQRRVTQWVETTLVYLVLVLIWLVAQSKAEHLPSRSRERFAVSLATHCLNAGFPNRKDMGSYQNYSEWPSAVVSRVCRCLKPWERKWLSEGILKPLALSNRSELYHAVLWCLNLAPTGSYSHKRKQLTSNTLAFPSGASFNARLWEAWHERTKLWGTLSGWRGLVVRCKQTTHTLDLYAVWQAQCEVVWRSCVGWCAHEK